ncbi:unnamed protein product [Knipowitschia caucasica]
MRSADVINSHSTGTRNTTMHGTSGDEQDLQDRLCVEAQAEFPRSYSENSAEEEHVLFIAQSFQRHFRLVYPDRKPLLLCPRNECGVKKLVTTTLRPTMPGLADLIVWQDCARFVSDFLTLQPLDEPTELPSTLRSPQTVLNSQRGTSLEYANVLCSLLLGLNYNAYCVSGYASKHLCELDRSQESCPMLGQLNQKHVPEPRDPDKNLVDNGDTYNLKMEMKLHSDFILKQENKKLEQQQQHEEPRSEPDPAPPPDPLWGLRVHFWVLVVAGSHSVERDFFIDPLSGKQFPAGHPDFLGVESVWNEFNVYINMEIWAKGFQHMVWDPEDQSQWQTVVPGTTSWKQLQTEAVRRQVMTKMSQPDKDTVPLYSYDMPLSWCTKIQITDRDLEMRWPGGFKVTHFKQAMLENFIPFFCPDGVVTRLTLYQDPKKTQVQTVKEWFQNRVDLLMETETREGITTERFKLGRSGFLTFHRFNTWLPDACPVPPDPGVIPEREMCFGPYRIDRLVHRLERGNHMIETFKKRRDFLYQRHTVFDGTRSSNADNWVEQRPILKVVEKFDRDVSKPASEDIAELAFHLAERRVEVTYHLEENTFIAAKRTFDKPAESTKTQKAGDFTKDMVSTFQVDPRVEPLQMPQLHQLLLWLLEEEQKTIRDIRNSQRSVRAMVQCRLKEQEDVRLEACPWTTTGTTQFRKKREKLSFPQFPIQLQ